MLSSTAALFAAGRAAAGIIPQATQGAVSIW